MDKIYLNDNCKAIIYAIKNDTYEERDADSEDIIIPVNNNWLDYLYKIINFICNLFKGRN